MKIIFSQDNQFLKTRPVIFLLVVLFGFVKITRAQAAMDTKKWPQIFV